MDGQTDGRTNRKIRIFFFHEGVTKVVFMKVALMSFFNYRWDKCHVLAIGGTYVDLIEGGTNVGGTNVGGTNVCGRKVAASSVQHSTGLLEKSKFEISETKKAFMRRKNVQCKCQKCHHDRQNGQKNIKLKKFLSLLSAILKRV